MDDTIGRQAALDALWKALYEYEDKTEKQFQESEDLDVEDWIEHRIFVQNMNDIDRQTILNLPSAHPEQTDCEYCHEDSDGYVRPIEKNSHAWLIRQGRTIKLRVGFKGGHSECDILFCPMCGRRLTDG